MRTKRAVMVIAPRMFRDEEYFQPEEILRSAGIGVTTASAVKGLCRGKLGAEVFAGTLVGEIDPAAYDAVIFIGGGGAACYVDDPAALSLARAAYAQGKLVCAICMAPLILAASGILKGKRATVFADDAPGLEKAGAVYTGGDVEIDGNIITASGPSAAEGFGKAIVRALLQRK